jgi:hypothetical protein
VRHATLRTRREGHPIRKRVSRGSFETGVRIRYSARNMIFGSMREARAKTGNTDRRAIANKTER